MVRRSRADRSRASKRPAERAPTERHGWVLLAHPALIEQLEKLILAAGAESTRDESERPNTKLLAHLVDLMLDKVPRNPGGAEYRHGGSLGKTRMHWFRAKTGSGRYRLFFRYSSKERIILYAWVNDADSLRTYGSRTDAYQVFADRLAAGNPPDDWDELISAARAVRADRTIESIEKRSSTQRRPGDRHQE
jgi:toxin YhaV